ncbi:hypothetical protein N665_0403s0001 [Sinapis alba]|nr:hypothetical protein N665_0403s0001 [Sinapis alba]
MWKIKVKVTRLWKQCSGFGGETIETVLVDAKLENAIVLCTIAGFDSDMSWYYLSCQKCDNKLLTVPSDAGEEGDDEDVFGYSYYCVKCKNHNPTIIPRYKLHMVELDNTSNTKFMLFDNQAKKLINQPCIELTGHPSNDEGSIMLTDPSSQQSEGFDLTPAKRVRAPSLNLEEQFDQNSVTRETNSIRIKKEKVDKSG